MSIITSLSNLTIYVEISNNGIDESSLFDELLTKEGANVTKKLSKGVNYIIYKEGRLKTVKYAMENNIPIVNPLWVDDKLHGIFNSDDKYLIKRTFTDLIIEEVTAKNHRRTKSPNDMKKKKKSSAKRSTIFLSARRGVKENDEERGVNSTMMNKANKENCNNIKITNYFCDRKKKIIDDDEEAHCKVKEKIKAFSYGLTEDQIDFLSSIPTIEYEGDIYCEPEKYQTNTNVVFLNSTFDKTDWKIISFFIEEKTVVNMGMFVNNTIANKEKEIDLSFLKEISYEKYFTKKPIKLKDTNAKESNISYYISENIPKNEYDICTIIMRDMFNVKLYTERTKNTFDSFVSFENCADEKVYKITNVKSYMNYEPRCKKKVYVYFDKVLSINYVYDSFYRGSLIELNEKNKDKYIY